MLTHVINLKNVTCIMQVNKTIYFDLTASLLQRVTKFTAVRFGLDTRGAANNFESRKTVPDGDGSIKSRTFMCLFVSPRAHIYRLEISHE